MNALTFDKLNQITDHRFDSTFKELEFVTKQYTNFELNESRDNPTYDFSRGEYILCNFEMYIFDKFNIEICLLYEYVTDQFILTIDDGYTVLEYETFNEFAMSIASLLED